MNSKTRDDRNSGSRNCSTALREAHEGGLFLSVFTVQMGETVMICRDRYTLRNGEVCEVKCGKVTPTGDRMEELCSLERVGDFDPAAKYEDFESVTMTRRQFERATCP